MRNYLNSKIYVIQNSHNSYKYIGATTDSLPKRFYKHKKDWMDDEILKILLNKVEDGKILK